MANYFCSITEEERRGEDATVVRSLVSLLDVDSFCRIVKSAQDLWLLVPLSTPPEMHACLYRSAVYLTVQ